ncbi:predicted protein [Coccidioides posadasii str. Silveira]|uniref:Predicted protein n=1 Tax=Coccidioides posadasii (strain RMSCC 757 / Silveira) TaxID=443226 RepID=E9D6E4_COCPS|nr:predicted protein [Coccidioides posadasii str. Silveira]
MSESPSMTRQAWSLNQSFYVGAPVTRLSGRPRSSLPRVRRAGEKVASQRVNLGLVLSKQESHDSGVHHLNGGAATTRRLLEGF